MVADLDETTVGGQPPASGRRTANLLTALVGVVCFLGALWLLHRELAAYRYQDIARAVALLPRGRLIEAFLATAASYLLLTCHDALALVYLRRPLPYRRTAFASYVAHSVTHSAGHSFLTGGTLRWRMYSGWGLTGTEVTALVGFVDLALWLGYGLLAGAAFLLAPVLLPAQLHLPLVSTRPIGVVLLVLVLGFLAWCAVARRPLTVRGYALRLPSLPLAASATAISTLDWALAGTALYALLPADAQVTLLPFLGAFLLAQTAGLLSQVPAGLGVFETVMVLLMAPYGLRGTALLGPLILFRVVYYLLPLILAAVMLGAHEALAHRRGVQRAASAISQWLAPLVPQLFAFTTFVAGAVLLFSGATPGERERLGLLRELLPLPIIELSHFVGSLAGITLLLLARGLQRRLDAAYVLTCVLLTTGIVVSLTKGVDYEEALLLSVMLAALIPCRSYFYRQAALAVPRLTAGWIAAIVLVLVSAAWLGIFSFKHVEYSNELWWQFAVRASAPRALRATVGALIVALAFALSRLLRPAEPERAPLTVEPARLSSLVEGSRSTVAYLALLRDKEVLLSPSGAAFLMYAVWGRSWIALGDPVGPPEEHADLVWRFREMVDRHGGWTVFYQVSPHELPLYLDLGLTLQKVGEEARVPLADFTLDGQERKKLRNAINRTEREGVRFEVLPASAVPALLPELRVVSDQWLAHRKTREKGFSLGFFAEDYLARCPLAVLRQRLPDGGERIVAFANLWLGAGREELSFDLMRHRSDAPTGVMEVLIARLMLWGREQGYAWCNLGMAPLSGLQSRALAPLWSRLGALLFRHGGGFYNFEGVRLFKQKFDPVWEPRYLATPRGVALPRVLASLSALIAGGWKGVIAR